MRSILSPCTQVLFHGIDNGTLQQTNITSVGVPLKARKLQDIAQPRQYNVVLPLFRSKFHVSLPDFPQKFTDIFHCI